MWHEFDWDPVKDASNQRKHGVAFLEAATVFLDPRALTKHDADHAHAEDRWITTGFSWRGRLLTVVHAEQDDQVRIISARQATRKESTRYGQGTS